MNSIKDDIGTQTIREIYNKMQIDEDWSIEIERGFTWWASQFKQTIWADQPVNNGTVDISRIHVETKFLKYPERTKKTDDQLAMMMRLSSLSGLIHDQQNGCLKWRCNAFVHEKNREWLIDLLCLASIIQHRDAEGMSILSEQPEFEYLGKP